MRSPGRDGYPVDENEKFYIDGEAVASIEFQGLEDSFGFSWGFPESQSMFPLTGYFPFLKGAAAYRFFIQDAISFEKSLRVAIGFGVNEDPSFRRDFSKPGSTLQLSSTVYWYQTEPHAPLPPMPPAVERAPAPEEPFWPDKEKLPSASELKSRGVKLEDAVRPPGQGSDLRRARLRGGGEEPATPGAAGGCRFITRAPGMRKRLSSSPCPKGRRAWCACMSLTRTTSRAGANRQVFVAGDDLGTLEKFQEGKWLEHPVSAGQTADGKVLVRAVNARKGSNAVISIIEWVEK